MQNKQDKLCEPDRIHSAINEHRSVAYETTDTATSQPNRGVLDSCCASVHCYCSTGRSFHSIHCIHAAIAQGTP